MQIVGKNEIVPHFIEIFKREMFICSVADKGCLSRIPDPDFYPSRIPDPGSRISDPGSRISDPKTATKEKGEKFFLSYQASNYTTLKIILFLKCRRKKFGPVFKELQNFLPKNLSSSQKYGFRIQDPEKNLFRIPDPGPGLKKAPDPGSGSATLFI